MAGGLSAATWSLLVLGGLLLLLLARLGARLSLGRRSHVPWLPTGPPVGQSRQHLSGVWWAASPWEPTVLGGWNAAPTYAGTGTAQTPMSGPEKVPCEGHWPGRAFLRPLVPEGLRTLAWPPTASASPSCRGLLWTQPDSSSSQGPGEVAWREHGDPGLLRSACAEPSNCHAAWEWPWRPCPTSAPPPPPRQGHAMLQQGISTQRQ